MPGAILFFKPVLKIGDPTGEPGRGLIDAVISKAQNLIGSGKVGCNKLINIR
jgi:hypothetical protein